MSARLFNWIWHVRGRVPLASAQTSDEAFGCLASLFDESGTTHRRDGDTLVFEKRDPGAQDKMAIFDEGTLRIDRDQGMPVLRYHLTSRALLFCFLAPLLFIAIAQFTAHVIKPGAESAAEKAKEAAKEAMPPVQNPIDKFLGAPAPDKPKKGAAEKEKTGKRGHGPSPTPAYVLAGMFAALWVIGRVLEDRLVRSLFRRRLGGATE